MLAWAGSVLALLHAVGCGIYWRVHRPQPGLGHWCIASLLIALSIGLMTLRRLIEDPWITRIVPTSILLLGVLLFSIGSASFGGRRPRTGWRVAVGAAASAWFAWFTAVDPQPGVRQAATSAVISLFFLLGAIELLRERRMGLRFSAWFCGLPVLVMGSWFATRSLRALFVGYSELLEPAAFQFITMSLYALLGAAITFGTVLMVSQRQVLALRLAKDEAMMLERRLSEERSRRQRQDLLRDLHDGLAGITAHLAMATSRSAGDGANEASLEHLRHLRHLAEEGNRELRLLMESLEQGDTCWPDALAAMRSHVSTVLAARRIDAQWIVSGQVPKEARLDAFAVLSLTRLVQEAVANLARHSSAHQAHIRFRFRPGAVGIAVRDDGRGMSQDARIVRGRGMGHMRQRAAEMGGRLRVRSGQGTSVCVALPLPLGPRLPGVHAGRAGMA
jgi:signal transduction histidine kinase